MLSATLPQETRKRLVAAYGGRMEIASNDYPLATWATPSAPVVQTPVDPRQINVRQVPVRLVQTVEEGDALALDAARQGQAVLRIRNTVGDAHRNLRPLSRQYDRVELFHARYAQIDRQQRENEVLARYGLDSGPQQRLGWLLVATQVVEQSLDLDFDLIVSDIAPVDLLIQRAGRLWRHTRPDRTPSARQQLVVVTPDLWPNRRPAGCHARSNALRVSTRTLHLLWLTARALAASGMIDAPGGLRPLIEAVYGGAGSSPTCQKVLLLPATQRNKQQMWTVAWLLVVSCPYKTATRQVRCGRMTMGPNAPLWAHTNMAARIGSQRSPPALGFALDRGARLSSPVGIFAGDGAHLPVRRTAPC